MEEACGAGGAIDLAGCFSFPVTDADLDALAEASAPLAAALAAKRVRALTPSLLVSEKLLRDCEPAVATFVQQTAKQRHEARTRPKEAKGEAKGEAAGGAAGKAGKAAGAAAEAEEKGRGKAGKAAQREAAALAALGGVLDDDDDDDDDGGGGKKAKGKKGKKGGGGGGKKAAAAEAADDGAAAGGESGEEALLEQLERALLQAVPSLDDVAELPAELARHLMPRATQRIAAEEVRLREAGAGDRRKLLQAVQESVESLGINVQAFAKGLSSLELDSGAGEALDKALVKGPCTDLWGAMLRSEALHAGHELPAAEPSDAAERKKAQAALLASLKPKAKAALEALEKGLSAKGGGVEGFCEALWKAEATLGEQFPRLDKKREKGVQQNCRAAWREQLQECSSAQPAVLLQLSLLLLHLDLGGALLFPVPLKLLPTLVDLLQPKLPDGAHATLTRFATLAQAALGAELPADQQAAAESLTSMVEEVRQLGLAKA